MKRKIISLIIIMSISMVAFWSQGFDVFAEENVIPIGDEEDIDISYFTPLNSVYGYANTGRGVYLATGSSSISKISSYQIGVGGITNAAIRCDVSVSVIVEKYNLERDIWGFVTSWRVTNENAFTAAISKSLIVDSGYYYRVRCLHYAGSDASSSYTNALYVGN